MPTIFKKHEQPSEYFDVFTVGGVKVPGLYDLNGPKGNVSFYSQQKRAFFVADIVQKYLSAAKKENSDETLTPNDVLIVGAGLSGSTCYLALKSMGVENVCMVDAQSEALLTQARSSHRYAHPSLAEWPTCDLFSSATNLPFLNWFSGDIENVVTQIQKDDIWKRHLTDAPKENVVFDVKVTSIGVDTEPKPFHPSFCKLTSNNSADILTNWETHGFRVVVFALGYSDHSDHQDFCGYFEANVVEVILNNVAKYHDRDIYITGAGDGAIIEAGNLCVESGMNEPNLVEIVAALRGDAVKKLDLTEDTTQISDFETKFSKLYQNDRAEIDEKSWMQTVRDMLPRDFTATIKELYQGKCRSSIARCGKVFLQSTSSPWKSEACSPISLLSYYIFSDVDNLGWRDSTSVSISRCYHKFPAKHLQSQTRQATSDPTTPNEITICRHTASRNSNVLLPNYKNFETRYFDAGVGELFTYGAFKEKFDDGTFYETLQKDESDAPDWKEYRLDLLVEYAKDRFKDASVTLEDGKVVISLCFEGNKDKYRKIGGFDRSIFGLDVVYKNTTQGGSPRIVTDDISNENETPRNSREATKCG